MAKEIEPIHDQKTADNAKGLSNSLDALLKCKELGINRGQNLFGPVEEPKNVHLDDTFEKVADGMQKGYTRELVCDGSPKTAQQIAENHPFYQTDKRNERNT